MKAQKGAEGSSGRDNRDESSLVQVHAKVELL